MLGNQQNSIHCEVASAQSERVLNRFAHAKAVRRREQAADVFLRFLIGVERHQLERRLFAFAIQRVGLEQTAHEHIGVGIMLVDRDNGGDFFRDERDSRFGGV